ncbi:MAG: helix-turn-helix transcriptional regulator [Candidatus Nealsonbacteria bacterium]
MNGNELGVILKRQRVIRSLKLRGLGVESGVSPSHLGRIERGERFPSALVLRKIAGPLGFEEVELFCLAGYLPSAKEGGPGEKVEKNTLRSIDPVVAEMLAQEPVEIQRTVIGILSILRSIAKRIT